MFSIMKLILNLFFSIYSTTVTVILPATGTFVRPREYICVFQVSRPYIGFCPDPKHFIVNCEQNVVKYVEKCSEKCMFYIKYCDKINNANQPYLAFSELKPETHMYFFLPYVRKLRWQLLSIKMLQGVLQM